MSLDCLKCGPKGAPQNKALKWDLAPGSRVSPHSPAHMSSVTPCQWLVDWQTRAAPRPGQGTADSWQYGPLSPSSVSPGTATKLPPVLSFSPLTNSTLPVLQASYFLHSALSLSL